MDEVNAAEKAIPARKRTSWLSFLIILSMVSSGVELIIGFASLIGGRFSGMFLKVPVLDAILLDNLYGNGLYISVKIILFALSLTGVIFMWKLKRLGFWFYLAAQVLLLIIPFILLTKPGIAYLLERLTVNVIFVLFFVILYSLQLKNMD